MHLRFPVLWIPRLRTLPHTCAHYLRALAITVYPRSCYAAVWLPVPFPTPAPHGLRLLAVTFAAFTVRVGCSLPVTQRWPYCNERPARLYRVATTLPFGLDRLLRCWHTFVPVVIYTLPDWLGPLRYRSVVTPLALDSGLTRYLAGLQRYLLLPVIIVTELRSPYPIAATL